MDSGLHTFKYIKPVPQIRLICSCVQLTVLLNTRWQHIATGWSFPACFHPTHTICKEHRGSPWILQSDDIYSMTGHLTHSPFYACMHKSVYVCEHTCRVCVCRPRMCHCLVKCDIFVVRACEATVSLKVTCLLQRQFGVILRWQHPFFPCFLKHRVTYMSFDSGLLSLTLYCMYSHSELTGAG